MPSATFFGATGGCALATLIKTLEAGITTTALARTPSKLHDLLVARGVAETTITAHLRIIQGNAKDIAAVKDSLQVAPNQLPDVIVSGIGGAPKLCFSLWPVTLDDPRICADAMGTLVTALRELRSAGATGRPLVAAVSTTGVSTKVRDVPLLFVPLYHWLLAVPHQDKRAMEVVLEKAAAEQGDAAPIKAFVAVRPSLLLDGEGVGLEKVRVGWEGGEAEGHGPAVGYTITRNDVGAWLFEELVKSNARDKWAGRMVTLTA